MIYTAEGLVAFGHQEDAPQTWLPLRAVPTDTYVAEARILDAAGTPLLVLDEPSADEVQLFRRIEQLSLIYQTAENWKQAVAATNGIVAAEAALLLALARVGSL